MRTTVVASVLLVLLFSCSSSSASEATVPCKWKDPDTGIHYDLTKLANSKEDYHIPKNTFPGQGWDIWINICRPTVSEVCGGDAAACMQWDPAAGDGGKATMGQVNTMTFSAGAKAEGKDFNNVVLQYVGGLANRQTEIDFICNPKGEVGSPKYINENPEHHYNFSWETKYACPATHGLSVGSILLILVFCLVVVYLVAGILFNRFKRGLGGIEMIPNVEFWSSLPGLVKDGIMFLVNKVRGRGSYTQV